MPPTILAIEDDPEVLCIIQAHLAGAGYRVLGAAEGEAGLELARTQRVDLITLDLLMSPVDGRDVFHRLRSDVATRNIPVLVTVADELADDIAAEGFVSKPFLGRRLLAEVRRLVPCPDRKIHIRQWEVHKHPKKHVVVGEHSVTRPPVWRQGGANAGVL